MRSDSVGSSSGEHKNRKEEVAWPIQQCKFPILMKAEDTFHRFGLLAFYRIQKVRVDMIVAVSRVGDLLAEWFAHPGILLGLP